MQTMEKCFRGEPGFFALNWIGAICGCFCCKFVCLELRSVWLSELSTTGVKRSRLHWDNRNMFPRGQQTDAAKGARQNLVVLPAELSSVWVLSTSYWFWRHERHKNEGAMENGRDMVLVTGSLYLWWGRACSQEAQECYFSFLPSVSILPDLVGRIPVSPLTPGSIYRGFDKDVLPQVQIPNGGSTATSMSRDRKPVLFWAQYWGWHSLSRTTEKPQNPRKHSLESKLEIGMGQERYSRNVQS